MEKLLVDTDEKMTILYNKLQHEQLEKRKLSSMLAADKKAHHAAITTLQHQVEHVHPKHIQDLHDKVYASITQELRLCTAALCSASLMIHL